jgi:asparagine synthetase B (glutamine-hydrolysing)
MANPPLSNEDWSVWTVFEQYRTNCVQHMRGMCAFALWDVRKKILFDARDRLGKKPFYYSKSPTGFFFGSAIRAITADPSVSISPDFSAIDNYLTRQYVPSPVTAFAGIFKLWNKSSGNGQFQSLFSGETTLSTFCSTG